MRLCRAEAFDQPQLTELLKAMIVVRIREIRGITPPLRRSVYISLGAKFLHR